MSTGEGAQQFQLTRRRGDGETRRDDNPLPSAPVPSGDQRRRVVVGAVRAVAEDGGCVAVHARLAGQHHCAALLAFGEQGFGRDAMHRAVGDSRCRAVAQQFVDEEGGLAGGVFGRCVARFGREGVLLKPVEELGAVGGDDLRLGEMDVGIDEAGQDELVAVVVDHDVRRAMVLDSRRVVDGGDPAIIDDDDCRAGDSRRPRGRRPRQVGG